MQKELKVNFTLEQIKQVVIEQDTFTVVPDYALTYLNARSGRNNTIVIPFDVIKIARRGEIKAYDYNYYLKADDRSTREIWLQKGDDKPVEFYFAGAEKVKILNLLKDKPAVYKKWRSIKNSELRSVAKNNIYQLVDDYNSAP